MEQCGAGEDRLKLRAAPLPGDNWVVAVSRSFLGPHCSGVSAQRCLRELFIPKAMRGGPPTLARAHSHKEVP